MLPDEQSHVFSKRRKMLQHNIKIPTILGQGAPSFRRRFGQKPAINTSRESWLFLFVRDDPYWARLVTTALWKASDHFPLLAHVCVAFLHFRWYNDAPTKTRVKLLTVCSLREAINDLVSGSIFAVFLLYSIQNVTLLKKLYYHGPGSSSCFYYLPIQSRSFCRPPRLELAASPEEPLGLIEADDFLLSQRMPRTCTKYWMQ